MKSNAAAVGMSALYVDAYALDTARKRMARE